MRVSNLRFFFSSSKMVFLFFLYIFWALWHMCRFFLRYILFTYVCALHTDVRWDLLLDGESFIATRKMYNMWKMVLLKLNWMPVLYSHAYFFFCRQTVYMYRNLATKHHPFRLFNFSSTIKWKEKLKLSYLKCCSQCTHISTTHMCF